MIAAASAQSRPLADIPTPKLLSRNSTLLHYWLYDTHTIGLPTLVFTHGAGADHRMFDTQVAALAGQYRLLTWDVRGHGQSRPIGDAYTIDIAVDDLVAILDREGIDQAVFIGQSMGGNISQALVQRYPERVQALVLVDCVCNTNALSAFEQWAIGLTPALLRLYPYDMLLRQSAQAVSKKREVQAYLYDAMKKLSKDDVVTVMTATTACLRSDPTYRIPKPFLLVRGEHDNAGAIKKQAMAWAAREPNCREYAIIPDAGHCANQDNPTVFNKRLMAFLCTLS